MNSHAARPTRSPASLRRRGTFAIAAAAVAVASLGTATPAFAKHGDGKGGNDKAVKSSAKCDFGGSLQLKVKPDDAKYEAEVEVDTNVAGQAHLVTFSIDGTNRWSGTAKTAGPSGSFSVQQLLDAAQQPAAGGGTGDDNGGGGTGGTDENPGAHNGGGGTDDNPGTDDNGGGTAGTDDNPGAHNGGGGTDDNPGTDDNGGGTAGTDDNPGADNGGGTGGGGTDDNGGAHGVTARASSKARAAGVGAANAAAPAAKHTFKVVSVYKGVSCSTEATL